MCYGWNIPEAVNHLGKVLGRILWLEHPRRGASFRQGTGWGFPIFCRECSKMFGENLARFS